MPQFRVKVRNIGGTETWEEPYDKDVPDVRAWANATIEQFNAHLRHGETPREVVDVIIDGESRTHNWEKTNLVTIVRGSRLYDTCRCTKCGITGKRFGLGSPIRDLKYKAAKYATCRVVGTITVEQ